MHILTVPLYGTDLSFFHDKGYDDIPKEITDPDAKKVANIKISHPIIFHKLHKEKLFRSELVK